MLFSFVDRILELEVGKRALGVKHVTAQDPFVEKVDEGYALYSCIIGEALGQLGAWCVMAQNDFRMRPVAGVVGEVKMIGRAYLGDTILLDTRIDSLTDEAVHYHSVGTVRGKTVFTLTDSLGPFLPMEQFSDPADVRAQFQMIHRPGTFVEPPEGSPTPAAPVTIQPVGFDRILWWEKGKEVSALKNVSILTPFLADHFARKRVLPLSILLEAQMQLARRFVDELVPPDVAGKIRPTSIRNIKMSDFVQPGSTLISRMTLLKQSGHEFTLRFRSEVDGKRVCMAEADFGV